MASRGKAFTTIAEFERCSQLLKLAQEQLDELATEMRKSEVEGFDVEAKTLLSQSERIVNWAINVRSAFAKERIAKKQD